MKPETVRFVRVPTVVLERLLHTPLNGTQWRVMLWVIRQTYGWNREWTRFSWYRIARELELSRPAVYRAGSALLLARVLRQQSKALAVQTDTCLWTNDISSPMPGSKRQLWMPGINVATRQRIALPRDNASVANPQRDRCQEATLFQRAKDSSKDKSNTYIKTQPARAAVRGGFRNGAFTEHPAGAARPIPGKYDELS